jgi:glutamate--cysteine ligase
MSFRTLDDVAAHVDAAVQYGAPGTVGAELEWLVADPACPSTRPAPARVRAALDPVGPLPGGSGVSMEPGGQIELSSAPRPGPAAAVHSLTEDVHAVRGCLTAAGLTMTGMGTDPYRPAARLVTSARYEVMERFYGRQGEPGASAGRAMMCSSAAVQVSLDAGVTGSGTQSAGQRWQRAHAIGPALVAAFACSPLLAGAPTGWRSTRQQFWRDIDPSRTRPPDPALGPVAALTELAVSAQVMTVRDKRGVCRAAPAGLTFADWMLDGAPTAADLDYHLTTLFPPVRLRGWLELRYLDMLPDPWWQVAVAVAAAVLDDDRAADRARAACAAVEGRWTDAARMATSDIALARAAQGCLEAAAEALPRMGAPELAVAVLAYVERYPARGRCPADDLLDAYATGVSVERLLVGDLRVAA